MTILFDLTCRFPNTLRAIKAMLPEVGLQSRNLIGSTSAGAQRGRWRGTGVQACQECALARAMELACAQPSCLPEAGPPVQLPCCSQSTTLQVSLRRAWQPKAVARTMCECPQHLPRTLCRLRPRSRARQGHPRLPNRPAHQGLPADLPVRGGCCALRPAATFPSVPVHIAGSRGCRTGA